MNNFDIFLTILCFSGGEIAMLNSFDATLERLDGYETDYVKILYYDLPANYADTYQSYGNTRFCTILEGDKHITVKDQSFTYDKNKSLLLPAYSKVFMEINRPTKALVFELNDKLIESVVQKVEVKTSKESRFNPASQVLVNNLASNIKLDLQQLTSSSYTHNKEPFLIDLYAQKLIYNLLHTEEANDIIVRQTLTPMDKAIQYIKENIDQPLSSKAVADYFNMSLSNFSHTFKKYVGQTPNKYINTLKMGQAKNLLATMSVTEAAFELGYETPSHFIRLFKQYYNLTPKQYQLKYLRG